MAWLGPALGLAGSLIGAKMKSGSVKDTNAQSMEVTRTNWDREDNFLQRRVADGRQAGIHPLAAIGAASPIPQSANLVTDTSGDTFADGVQRFGEHVARNAQRKADQKSRDLADQLLAARIDTEGAKAAALLAEAQSRTAIKDSKQKDSIPLYVQYVGENGETFMGPNPKIADVEQFAVPPMLKIQKADRALRDRLGGVVDKLVDPMKEIRLHPNTRPTRPRSRPARRKPASGPPSSPWR